MEPMNGLKCALGTTKNWGGLQTGQVHRFSKTTKSFAIDKSIFSAYYKNAAGHEAGTMSTWDHTKGKMDLVCAARLQQ